MPRLVLATLFLLAAHLAFFGQTVTEPKRTEEAEKLREKAVEFLRETSQDVSRMRSVENRISFSAELASLMWFHSEKETKTMYYATMADFKQLVMQLDAEYNMLDPALATDEDAMGPSFFGGGGRSPIERKMRIAMAVRQQIAMSLAEHEPELAYNFFYDTGALITNPQFRTEIEEADKNFEIQLVKQIAETNAASAAKLAARSIKDGIDGNHVELLKKIYTKDADKGIEFGAALLSKIKSDKDAVKGLYVYSSLLNYGAENLEESRKPKGKKPIYSQSDLRDLAESFARDLLDGNDEEAPYGAVGYADQIDKFAPGRGAQIRAKYKASNNGAMSAMTNAANKAAYAMANAANAIATNSNSAGGPDVDGDEAAKREEEIAKQFVKDVETVGSKSLPKEEREKIVAKVRKVIATTPGKDKKITALSLLAAQVAKAGDKELADEIMRDAERLINPSPKNYRDFLYTWMVSSGYAEANPEKAFPMLESTILRANETISAFVKVAEFIDVNEEMVDDGEVQVGMFGGQMIRGVTKELGIANTTLMSLAKADFTKTKALTNAFDRVEIRVLAKMLILRAVLDDKKKDDPFDKSKGFPDGSRPDPMDPR